MASESVFQIIGWMYFHPRKVQCRDRNNIVKESRRYSECKVMGESLPETSQVFQQASRRLQSPSAECNIEWQAAAVPKPSP